MGHGEFICFFISQCDVCETISRYFGAFFVSLLIFINPYNSTPIPFFSTAKFTIWHQETSSIDLGSTRPDGGSKIHSLRYLGQPIHDSWISGACLPLSPAYETLGRSRDLHDLRSTSPHLLHFLAATINKTLQPSPSLPNNT